MEKIKMDQLKIDMVLEIVLLFLRLHPSKLNDAEREWISRTMLFCSIPVWVVTDKPAE